MAHEFAIVLPVAVSSAVKRAGEPSEPTLDQRLNGPTLNVAGAHGSRTHRAAPGAAPLVLKTRGPTGTQPLPVHYRLTAAAGDSQRGVVGVDGIAVHTHRMQPGVGFGERAA